MAAAASRVWVRGALGLEPRRLDRAVMRSRSAEASADGGPTPSTTSLWCRPGAPAIPEVSVSWQIDDTTSTPWSWPRRWTRSSRPSPRSRSASWARCPSSTSRGCTYEDPTAQLAEIAGLDPVRDPAHAGDLRGADRRSSSPSDAPAARGGVTVAGARRRSAPSSTGRPLSTRGVDLFVIRGTTVSAEHVSGRAEPLNLKRFISTSSTCPSSWARRLLHGGPAPDAHGRCWGARRLRRGAAHTTRKTLGIHAPMASAVAVAAARRDYLDESGGRYVHVIADGGVAPRGHRQGRRLRCRRRHARCRVGSGDGRARARVPLGPGGAPFRAAARRAHGTRHAGLDRRSSSVRGGRPTADEPRRCPAARDGYDRVQRRQGVPARRGGRLALPRNDPRPSSRRRWARSHTSARRSLGSVTRR